MTITRLNTFHAKPGRGAALRRFLTSVITDVRAAPGCRSCELYEALDDPEHFAVVEIWETVEAHKAAGRAIAPARTFAASGAPTPNMRLKLAGALVPREAVVSCPGGHGTSSCNSCAGGRVARSLSAIR